MTQSNQLKPGKYYGYNCPICGEPIKEPQPTEHTEDGLAHAKCCTRAAQPEKEKEVRGDER